jgi:hypothetical protein
MNRTISLLTRSLFIVVIGVIVSQAQEKTVNGVPYRRIEKLMRGVNHASYRHCDNGISRDYVRKHKERGRTFIRFSVGMKCLKAGTTARSGAIDVIKKSIENCKAEGLMCVVQMHDCHGSCWNVGQEFIDFFDDFSKKLADTDPEYCIIEMINEPSSLDPDDWSYQAHKVAKVVRKNMPDHTIVCPGNQRFADSGPGGGDSGSNWDHAAAFTKLIPVPDVTNVAYTFHDYQPMSYTHQGMSWAASHLGEINGLAYPMDETNARKVQNRCDHPYCTSTIDNYIADGWNAEVYMKRYDQITEWQKAAGYPFIYCGEIGASKKAPGYTQYCKDITAALEAHNIGWAPWPNYDGSPLHNRPVVPYPGPFDGEVLTEGTAMKCAGEIAGGFSLYSAPGSWFVSYTGTGSYQVSVLNLQGKIVLHADAVIGTKEISLNGHQRGIYLLHCKAGNAKLVRTVVLK